MSKTIPTLFVTLDRETGFMALNVENSPENKNLEQKHGGCLISLTVDDDITEQMLIEESESLLWLTHAETGEIRVTDGIWDMDGVWFPIPAPDVFETVDEMQAAIDTL